MQYFRVCVAHTFAHDTQKVRKGTTFFSITQIFLEILRYFP